MNFAKSIIQWYGGAKVQRKEEKKQIAEYLRTIEKSLSEYAELIRNGDDIGRGHMVKNRYYLESCLCNLARVVDSDDEKHPTRSAIDRLKSIKVYDGALVPEVSAMLEGSSELTTE